MLISLRLTELQPLNHSSRRVRAYIQTAKFLISQQKYLEALEGQQKFDAMVILQQEIAPVDIERDRLNHLSR